LKRVDNTKTQKLKLSGEDMWIVFASYYNISLTTLTGTIYIVEAHLGIFSTVQPLAWL
jgi:hypothetical protein